MHIALCWPDSQLLNIWTDGMWASFCLLVMGSSDIRGRPDERHCGGPGCGQGTHFWFPQTVSAAPAQVSQDICPVWKRQSNSMKLIPGRKLVDLQGKPTQAAKRETSIQSLSLWGYVESGLEDGRWLQEVLETRLGITERRQKSHFSFLSVHSKAEIHSTNISRVLIVVIIIKIAKIY